MSFVRFYCIYCILKISLYRYSGSGQLDSAFSEVVSYC